MAIDYEVRDSIAYISFCRPEKHNALRDEDLADLSRALHHLDREDDALIAVLSGQGVRSRAAQTSSSVCSSP
jgi:enoyl-CoA hydratase/carnithine racemase